MSVVTARHRIHLLTALCTIFLQRVARAQDEQVYVYCSGVAFLSENTGFITDGAVDTGMGVYHSNTNCKWVIKPTINDFRAAHQKRVVLNFDYVNVESGFDFIRVYETNPAGKLLGVFTGNLLPPTVVSTTDVIYVQFQTDATGQRLGFRANWHTTGCPNECGSRGSCVNMYCFCDEGYFGGDCSSSFCLGTKTYTAIVGSMMDHYRTIDEEGRLNLGSDLYQNNADCRWLLKPLMLTAPYFTVDFMLMDTEVGRDVLYIYDGGNMNAPLLAQVSGPNISMPLLDSAGSQLFIRFVSDKMKSGLGVFIQWDTIKECGGIWGFCNDGGYDAFTGLYRPNHGWCWDSVNNPPEHDKKGRCICQTGWFGGDCSYPYCLGAKTLTGRKGSLMDHHDTYIPTYDVFGALVSNNTPAALNDYRPSSYCRWYIKPNETVNFIVVTIDYFDLEQGADFLKVYDGNGFYNKTIVRDTNHNYVIDGIMTGNGIVNAPTVDLANPKFFSTGPNLFFQFKSDVSNARPRRGFKMSYEGVYCAGKLVLTGASGTLTDGSPPGQMYYPYTQCSWHIAPESRFFLTGGAVIELEVVSVNVFKDRLNIYEGSDDTGAIIQKYRGKLNNPQYFTTSGNDIFLQWDAGCAEATCERGLGWEVRWSIRQETDFCSPEFPTTLTAMYSDIYPYPPGTAVSYRNRENCTWLIDVPGPVEEMTITIRSMNLAVEYTPNPDYVEIYRGHEELHYNLLQKSTELLSTFGVRGLESRFVLTTGKALIRFVSNDGYQGSGWNIAYEAIMTSPEASRIQDMSASSSSVVAVAGVLQTIGIRALFAPYCQPHMVTALGCLPYTCPDESTVPQASGPALQVCSRTGGGANFSFSWKYGRYIDNQIDFSKDIRAADATIHETVKDTGTGLYTVTYTPTYTGSLAAFVRLNGIKLGSSAAVGTGMSTLTINVLPAIPEPSKAVAYDVTAVNANEMGGMTGGAAGNTYQFKIKSYDAFGNAQLNGDSRWPNAFMVKFDSGSSLWWGTVTDDNDGLYTVTYKIDIAGEYLCHIMQRATTASYVAIQNSPFTTSITKVVCPRVGDPEACNGKGICLDTGICVCEVGWDGDYCEEELAEFLRLAIVLENFVLLAIVLAFCLSQLWTRCVVERQIFERLKYEDIEEDW